MNVPAAVCFCTETTPETESSLRIMIDLTWRNTPVTGAGHICFVVIVLTVLVILLGVAEPAVISTNEQW